MFQAIVTRYLPANNTKGARIKASCQAGSVTLAWDYGLEQAPNHAQAAARLVHKLGWIGSQGVGYKGRWVAGALPNADMVFVFNSYTEFSDDDFVIL